MVSYLRWRHRRGYGVHSPYAFMLVENVIRPGRYGYYGYSEIDRAFLVKKSSSEILHNEEIARFVLRLTVNLPAKRLVTFVSDNIIKVIAKGAGIKSAVCNDTAGLRDGDLLIVRSNRKNHDKLMEALEKGVSLLIIGGDRHFASKIRESLSYGLLFDGTKYMIAVPRKEMAFVNYLI